MGDEVVEGVAGHLLLQSDPVEGKLNPNGYVRAPQKAAEHDGRELIFENCTGSASSFWR
jgi:hypothetical protein